MQRENSQPSSSSSLISKNTNCRITRKAHFYSPSTAPAPKMPVSLIQAQELIKEVMAKHKELRHKDSKNKDVKQGVNQSYYSIINKADSEYHIVVVPRSCQDDPSSLGEAKALNQFLHKNSVYLLDYSHVLGEGGQGKVILAFNLATSERVAAKICNTTGSEFDRKQAQSERDNLAALGRHIGSSSSLLSMVKKGVVPPEVTLMTYYPGTNLANYLYQKHTAKQRDDVDYYHLRNPINVFKKMAIIMGMLKQVSELHKNKLIHRDIKTENFIVNETEEGKIEVVLVDLGEAVSSDVVTMEYASTFGYAAPETYALMLDKAPYTFQTDYYSLGVSIAEVLSDKNYQVALRELRKLQIARDHADEATTHEIFNMMSDVFLHQIVTDADTLRDLPMDYDYEMLVNYLDNTIYQRLLRHAMHAFLLSLTKDNPKQRLVGSTLDEELAKIQLIYNRCLELSRSLHTMAKEIIYVCDALESSGNTVNKAAIYRLFLSQLNALIREAREKKMPSTEVEAHRPALMSKAADMCITLFCSDKEGMKRAEHKNDKQMLMSKLSA